MSSFYSRPNDPHKLTKAAERWLGGEPPWAAPTARGGTSAADRSRHCVFVAAAAAPP